MKKYMLILLLFITGCNKSLDPLYIELVHQHNTVTKETLTSVRNSINDDLNDHTALSPEDKAIIDDLFGRLDYIIRSGDVIDQYTQKKVMTKEDFEQLLRNKWNRNKN